MKRKSGSLVQRFAEQYGVEPAKLMTTLKKTCFQQKKGGEVTNEQMMTLLIVAEQHGLNPFCKEIYAFPDKGGIIPVVSVDGWARIINSHPAFDGMSFNYSDEEVTLTSAKPCPKWCECVIYRKDRDHPITIREYVTEVYRPPFAGKGRDGNPYTVSGPWQTHTRRFLRHKAMIQCARLAFGFAGIYDHDESERIQEGGRVLDAEIVTSVPAQSGTEALRERLSENPAPEGGLL